jgi:hypothetical protein
MARSSIHEQGPAWSCTAVPPGLRRPLRPHGDRAYPEQAAEAPPSLSAVSVTLCSPTGIEYGHTPDDHDAAHQNALFALRPCTHRFRPAPPSTFGALDRASAVLASSAHLGHERALGRSDSSCVE